VEHGFGCLYPLAPIVEKLGITEKLYDTETSSGVLWDIGPHGSGLLYIPHSGDSASVDFETHAMLEHWSHPRSEPVG